MENFIENGMGLRKFLGSHLKVIRSLDPAPIERRRTQSYRTKLITKHGPKCCLCLKERVLEAAHIEPLELGATTTEPNLVLLCRLCHKLYDSGHLSISTMKEIASDWRKGMRQLPLYLGGQHCASVPAAITPPPEAIRSVLENVLVLQRRTALVKAIKVAKTALGQHHPNTSEHARLLIKIAELTRRRAKRGVLRDALEILQSVDLKTLNTKYHSLYYYELNYVYRLSGRHREAAEAIELSLQSTARSTKKDRVLGADYVAAKTNAILCELASIKNLTSKQAENFIDEFNRLSAIAGKQSGYWGGRWVVNSEAHIVQVWIKSGDAEKSWRSLEKAKRVYHNSDTSNGWDLAARGSLSLLDGMVHVMFPRQNSDLKHGIGILARSFAGRVGPRKRPEGIRDVGYSLARALYNFNKEKYRETATLLTTAMERTIDGTSYIWPYSTDS